MYQHSILGCHVHCLSLCTAHYWPPSGTINHWICWLLHFHLLSCHHSCHFCCSVVSITTALLSPFIFNMIYDIKQHTCIFNYILFVLFCRNLKGWLVLIIYYKSRESIEFLCFTYCVVILRVIYCNDVTSYCLASLQLSEYHSQPALPHTCQPFLCHPGGRDFIAHQRTFWARHGV